MLGEAAQSQTLGAGQKKTGRKGPASLTGR